MSSQRRDGAERPGRRRRRWRRRGSGHGGDGDARRGGAGRAGHGSGHRRGRQLGLGQALVTEGTIALAGNPNTGKSTVFNALTGSNQHVGNWPGKTVAKKTGTWNHDGRALEVVDLPGTYSLSAYSLEEIIARNYIVDEKPDVVVVVIDAANVERNLYLATQILEMRGNVVVALNMADAAAARGVRIDTDVLAKRLGVPVVSTAANKGRGMDELKTAVLAAVVGSTVAGEAPGGSVAGAASDGPAASRSAGSTAAEAASDNAAAGAASDSSPARAARPTVRIEYGPSVERQILALRRLVEDHEELSGSFSPRWMAIKLLEGDPDIAAKVTGMPGTEAVVEQAKAGAAELERSLDDDVDTLIADGRYEWIHDLVQGAVQRPSVDQVTLSDRIDAVVTHRLLGIPIFLLAMWLVFKLTTDVSAPYLGWVASVIDGPITSWTVQLVSFFGLSGTWVEGLLVDGVVAGVGGVMAFIPVLMSLYLVLALLEDSGYMSRAAFVMDRLMRGFGLHGKSFLPMLVGFGCTVPAIYATRTLKNERDRILTGLLVPFMSCGARLPVYVLFAAIFFPNHAGTIVFSMYLVGIVTAVVLGLVLQSSVLRTGEPTPFVMELPPYRIPTARGVVTHMWSRTRSFVRKAWTIILVVSIVLWFFMSIPGGGAGLSEVPVEKVDDSLFASAAGAVAPLFAPLGFDSWEATGSLMTGLIAKEVVVSTMSQVYGAEIPTDAAHAQTSLLEDLRFIVEGFVEATIDTLKSIPLIVGIDLFEDEPDEAPSELMGAIHADFERSSGGYAALAGLAFMVFVLLYTPCMVAIAAARHEFGARWMWMSVIGQFAVAWLVAFAVFQGGRLLAG